MAAAAASAPMRRNSNTALGSSPRATRSRKPSTSSWVESRTAPPAAPPAGAGFGAAALAASAPRSQRRSSSHLTGLGE